MHVTPQKALALLRASKSPFIKLFEHTNLEVEIYKPEGRDLQTPHTRDEIYVIISGNGEFTHEGEVIKFSPGDVIFVPAYDVHQFTKFSEDFMTWVFFFGEEK